MICKGSRKVMIDDSVEGTAWLILRCVMLPHTGRCKYFIDEHTVILFDPEGAESERKDEAGAR